MCGIVGYTGPQDVLPILLDGLTKLEYRGYDSAGVAVWNGDSVTIRKEIGKLENLKQKLKSAPLPGHVGMGHTRWATHGGVTEANAHPHTSNDGSVVLIHNGIIENYQDLKAEQQKAGDTYRSQTDTEVLAHQIEHEYRHLLAILPPAGPARDKLLEGRELFTEAVRIALGKVEGGYGIVVMHRDHPGLLVTARMHNPLILGLGKGENLVASDVPALLKFTNQVYDLQNGEIAQLTADSVDLFDLNGERLKIRTRTIQWTPQEAEKGGYPHFLIKEIHETPRVVRDVLRGKLRKHRLDAAALGLSDLDWTRIDKITLLGCGSAAYACYYGKYLFERWARVTTEVWFGSEYRYHEPVINDRTLVIALSQSGETADTLASIAKARSGKPARIVGVINAMGSSMTREVDAVCSLQAGPEISVASTKAFSSMALSLSLMALHATQARGTQAEAERGALLAAIDGLPQQIEQVLNHEAEIARIAMSYIHHHSAYYIGRDVNYPSAMEGAQKLKELSYIHAEAYAAGELKHGPNAVIEPGFPVICLAPKGDVYKKMISNIQEMKARDANILAFATEGDAQIADHADHVVYLPDIAEPLSVLINTIAMQLFAYYVTLYKGYSIDHPRRLKKYYPRPGQKIEPPKSIDIDKPRNLAKSVTVE